MSTTEMETTQVAHTELTPAEKRAALLAKAGQMKKVAAAEVATATQTVKVEGDAKKEGEGSPRSQKARGVPEGWKTTVLPIDFPPDTHAILLSAVKQRNLTMPAFLSNIIKEAIKAEWELLVADAKKYDDSKNSKGDSAAVTKLVAMTEEQRIAYLRGEQEKIVQLLVKAGFTDEQARTQVFGAIAQAKPGE